MGYAFEKIRVQTGLTKFWKIAPHDQVAYTALCDIPGHEECSLVCGHVSTFLPLGGFGDYGRML